MKTIFWGALVLAALLLILVNQQTITPYFARGGFSAAGVLAIATLLFYFLAGTFADSLGKALGLKRAGKKF